MANTQTFWIPPGFNGARWAIETELVGAALASPVLALVALAGLIITIVTALRRDAEARTALDVIGTLSAGLALALAVLVVAHIHRPLLITRYLVAVDPVVALILAVGAWRLVSPLPPRIIAAIDLAVLLGAGLAIHVNLDRTLKQPSWNETGRAIVALVDRCRDTRVYANMDWNAIPRDFPPPENRAVVPFAYATVAKRLGFALAPSTALVLSHTCPTVFWTEHVGDQHPAAQTVIDRLRHNGYPIGSGRMLRMGRGWILVARP